MLPLLARHVAECTDEDVQSLARRDGAPFASLPEMQALALKIAVRSMFSLGTWEHGPAVQSAMMRFARECARARLSAMIVPLPIPTYHDIARAYA